MTRWEGHPRSSAGYRRILIGLFAAGIATFSQLYSPQGILPLIGRALSVNAATSATTISAGTLGLAVSVLAWSAVADRLGRGTTMKIAICAAAVLGFLAPLAPTFHILLGTRLLEGVALGGIPAIAITYLHEELESTAAPVAASIFISGTTIGGLSGRVVAAPVAAFGSWRVGLGSVAVLAGIATVIFVVIIPRARGFNAMTRLSLRGLGQALLINVRDLRMLVLYAQAFLLMGGFVAIYNYLGYRLEQPPFLIPVTWSAMIFFGYLAGTVSARVAGGLIPRYGRRSVLLASTGTMLAGVALTMPDWLPTVLIGLLILTAGFFAAHSTAAGWVGHRATSGAAQATSLYNVGYYAGSSLFGWVGGIAYAALSPQGWGWLGTAAMVLVLAMIALVLAALALRE